MTTQLETLAQVRESERDEAQRIFLEKEAHVASLRRQVEDVKQARTKILNDVTAERAKAEFDVVGRAALTDYVRASDIEISELNGLERSLSLQLTDAIALMDAARDDLLDAQTQLAGVEKEFEKRMATAKKKQERKEEAAMDEIAAKQWWEKS